MHKFSSTIAKITAVATLLSLFVTVSPALAAETSPVSLTYDPWEVAVLSRDSVDSQIEAYKVDKNLVAWTELSGNTRKLYVFDGVQTRLLAAFDKADWKDDGNGFYDAVKGNFDVADGLVVWTMSDGHDREIYSFDGDSVKKVSDNSYDDRHPITSAGRIAWTSQPSANAYNLMVKDQKGVRRVDTWPATNYAFSDSNLFWLNTRPNENWMHVLVNTGAFTGVVGQGDDRPLTEYFTVDGKGNAAWEYSTKNWSYDKRITYVSMNGLPAIEMLQRDVPPKVTRLEDMDNGKVLMNVTDLLLTDLAHKSTLLELTNYYNQKAIYSKESASKARYMDGGYVTMREPNAITPIVFHSTERSFEDVISFEPVILDRFDADGSAAAGARYGGGLVTYTAGQSVVIPSTVETSDLTVKNGNIAWIEGVAGNQTLKFAATKVVVKTAVGPARYTGHLVKSPTSPAVYFAAQDGKRYVFTGQGQFYSYFNDFASVQVVSAAKLASIPVGGDVLYQPETKLLKIALSPKVYSISKDGSAHWIQSEEAAQSVYGVNWKQKIVTVDETELADYPTGGPIMSSLAYYSGLN